jgi:hypothetical protein
LLTSADRPQGTHFVAGVGQETIKFDPPVKLLGKAESYLLQLLNAQIYTLSKCLKASVAMYPQMQRVQWMMQKSPETGESTDPAQIILLVSNIDFVRTVEKAMQVSSVTLCCRTTFSEPSVE